MAYSIDLRKRIIATVDEGKNIAVVSEIFKVSDRVIYKWLKLRRETNSLEPKSGYQKGHSHKIKDWDQFKLFAEANKYCSIPMMVNKWKQFTGDDVSESVMQRSLKKINYTSKKNF